MAGKFDWRRLDAARKDLLKRAEDLKLKKQAFLEMPGGAPPGGQGAPAGPGGAPMDPAMAGGAPMDPAMAGGMPMDPAMAGGMPPEMAGLPPDALAAMAGGGVPPMGVDPATAGMLGGAPADPAASGAAGALAGGAAAGAPEPTLTLTLSQLWDVVTKVLGLAKKIGANGQGVATEAAPTQAGVSQDAIKSAVIEALGSMGAMKMAADSSVGPTNQVPKITLPKRAGSGILNPYYSKDRTNLISQEPRTPLPKGVDPRILSRYLEGRVNTIPKGVGSRISNPNFSK